MKAWSDDPNDLRLLAMDQRTKSYQAESVNEMVTRIAANALHATDCTFHINTEESTITTIRAGEDPDKCHTCDLDEFVMKVNMTSQSSVNEIEFLGDCEDESIPKELTAKENKAIQQFEGMSQQMFQNDCKHMFDEVVHNQKRYGQLVDEQ